MHQTNLFTKKFMSLFNFQDLSFKVSHFLFKRHNNLFRCHDLSFNNEDIFFVKAFPIPIVSTNTFSLVVSLSNWVSMASIIKLFFLDLTMITYHQMTQLSQTWAIMNPFVVVMEDLDKVHHQIQVSKMYFMLSLMSTMKFFLWIWCQTCLSPWHMARSTPHSSSIKS